MDYKAIFEALPHVNTIWIVGENFHLHSDYGGEKIERNALKTETVNLINEPVETEVIKPKGRPKKQ